MLRATRPIVQALLAALLAAPGIAAADQTPAEGRLDLRDLLARLPGRYDNEPQRFFLDGMQRASERPPRAHVVITRLPGDAPARVEIVEHADDEHSPVRSRTTWEFAVASSGQVVARNATAGSRCELAWQRRAGVFVADAPPACGHGGAESGLITAGARLWLSRDELWRDMPGQVRPLQLLRHGLWPSVSGNNFVPLMNLYLYEGADRRMLGNGWATPESGRVGFGIGDELAGGQSASARCTRLNP